MKFILTIQQIPTDHSVTSEWSTRAVANMVLAWLPRHCTLPPSLWGGGHGFHALAVISKHWFLFLPHLKGGNKTNRRPTIDRLCVGVCAAFQCLITSVFVVFIFLCFCFPILAHHLCNMRSTPRACAAPLVFIFDQAVFYLQTHIWQFDHSNNRGPISQSHTAPHRPLNGTLSVWFRFAFTINRKWVTIAPHCRPCEGVEEATVQQLCGWWSFAIVSSRRLSWCEVGCLLVAPRLWHLCCTYAVLPSVVLCVNDVKQLPAI